MDLFGDINLTGLLSIIIFYLLILGVGMWAARKKSDVEGVSEEVKIDLASLPITSRHFNILSSVFDFYLFLIESINCSAPPDCPLPSLLRRQIFSLLRRRQCWQVAILGCSWASSPWLPPGWEADISTARRRLSSTTVSSGVRRLSATRSVWCWAGSSLPTRWGRRATWRCWTPCRTPTGRGWEASSSCPLCVAKSSGPPGSWRLWVSLTWPDCLTDCLTDWLHHWQGPLLPSSWWSPLTPP